MGFKIIKKLSRDISKDEHFHISKDGKITFSKALWMKHRIDKAKYVILMKDTDTKELCFDFKDTYFPDSFKVCSCNGGKIICIYGGHTIKSLGIYGDYHFITVAGNGVYKSDLVLK